MATTMASERTLAVIGPLRTELENSELQQLLVRPLLQRLEFGLQALLAIATVK